MIAPVYIYSGSPFFAEITIDICKTLSKICNCTLVNKFQYYGLQYYGNSNYLSANARILQASLPDPIFNMRDNNDFS